MSHPSPARPPAPAPDVSDAPLPPLVFQCRACRRVVGDSTGVDCSVRSLGVVALTAVCGVAVDTAPRAAALPPDAAAPPTSSSAAPAAAGCVGLACAGCGAALGQRFGSDLPPRLARVTGLFCLSVDALTSHELGCAELLARRTGEGGASVRGGGKPAPAAPADVAALTARLAALEDEVVRVQGVLLAQNERLGRLESA